MKFKARTAVLFLLAILSASPSQAQTVVRGPYLQMQDSDGITIHWRTDIATDSVVRYGTSAGNLNFTETVAGLQTEHEVSLSGLGTAQQIWYSVGETSGPLAGDSTYHFHTAPTRGQAADTRIWVIGDSGTANLNARNVRDAYKTWTDSNPADLWLMLGDNAYNDGYDFEFQAAVFDTYPEVLRQLPLWPTLGNHDGHQANSDAQTGPYYDIFNLPTGGEIGGLLSGTEAYYSFDYANIHFICLDSYETDRSINGTMLTWLESDLAMNNQPWVIAFWHHPPYSKGSHNSDSTGEVQMTEMRQNVLPILEAWGVDLIMTGHSHSYERSMLLDGHYGVSTTLDPIGNILDPGDGLETGDGVYEKPDTIAAEHAGAVYAVAGSSGKISGGALDHPVMYLSLNSLGSLVMDVSGNRLDVRFIDDTAAVLDEFSLVKTPDFEAPLIGDAAATDATHVLVNFNEVLSSTEAMDSANYSIAGLTISQAELVNNDRSVRLTTSTMTSGSSYTLLVSNLKDLAGNTIVPNSSVNFDFFEVITVAFQDGLLPSPGYDGTADAYIRENTPDTAYGLASTLQVDGDDPSGSTNDMNILLGWDISVIPDDAIVEAAEFQLEVTNISPGSYGCYGLLRNWDQADVTWNQATSGAAWTTPGAESASERGADLVCTVNAGSTGPLTVVLNTSGLALLQDWVNNPASNHGLIISDSSTSDGADFHSSESTTAMARPKLQVTYRVPVIEPPGSVDQPATADLPSAGSVSGSYLNTQADDGNAQSITERQSGGKKNSRYSYLSHSWQFSVAAGSEATLFANVWSGGSSEGDSFTFAWSSDNNNFNSLFTISSTDPNQIHSAVIPASGAVYIRVTDNDQTPGRTALDTVYIDHLYIRSGEVPPVDPPLAPVNLQAGTISSSSIALSWQRGAGSEAETGFELQRRLNPSGSWATVATPGGGSTSHLDTGLNANTMYDYRIRASNSGGDSPWSVPLTGVSTLAEPDINLSANGYKVKGKHFIDLTWSGASSGSVDIRRNGAIIATISSNSGSYTDDTGAKGATTYIYRVCEAGSNACSSDVSVVF